MNSHEVLGIFTPPTLEECENAISRAILRIRSTGVTRDQLAKKLDCSPSTIDAASNGRSLLGFDHIALLAHHYPEEFSLIEALWSFRSAKAPTVEDRIEHIERELDAIRRELAQ